MERTHLRDKVRKLSGSLVCPQGRQWPTDAVGQAGFSAAALALRGGLHVAKRLRELGLELGLSNGSMNEDTWLSDKLARYGWPTRAPQIALLDAGEWSVELCRTEGVLWPDWYVLSRGDAMPSVLDASVTCSRHHDLQITLPERTGKDAAWFDWAHERPLCFSSVFPVRLDCSRVTLATGEAGYQPLLKLVRLLLDFACVTARHPMRTTTRDRIDGRTFSWAMVNEHKLGGTGEPLAHIARPMVEQLKLLDDAASQTGAAKVAARVLGAWASMADDADAALRRDCAETSLDVLGSDIETLLRTSSVRLADSDDDAALSLLEEAAMQLQSRELISPTDQINFVLSELYTEPGSPLAVGRAAAGVVLIGARVPKEQLPYFRDDILDEVEHAGSLVGLDQHKAMVLEAFRMLESIKGLRPTKGPKLRLVGQKKTKAGKRAAESKSETSTKVARAGKVAEAGKTAKPTTRTKKKPSKKSAVVGRIAPQQSKPRKRAA
ncbi:MAG: hypothetical protein ACK5ZG_12775 [Phycisphaerae bacterium]|jgi:hypothetical protein